MSDVRDYPVVGKNKKALVYETLKSRIVRNELKPMEYLNEQVLCKELGVSKTPVREALQQLESDRFVVIVPNKGCFVSNISLDMIREVFEIREIYECAAARLAASRASRGEFADMLERHDSFKIVEESERKNLLLSGYQIHTIIIEAVGNSFLTDYYRTILDHIVRIRLYFIGRFGMERLHDATDEHKKVLQAIVDGDAEGAEVAMREHLRNALASIRQLI